MGPESGTGRSSSSTGSPARWQNWLENIPHFARKHRVIALDLPGFGAARCRDWEHLHPGLRPLRPRLLRRARRRAVHDRRQLDGRLHRGRDGDPASPSRFEKLVLVSAAGISHARMRRQPAEVRRARWRSPPRRSPLRSSERGLRRPRLRRTGCSAVSSTPRTGCAPSCSGSASRTAPASPASCRRVRGLIGYDILDRLEEVEVPTLIVWGRNDHIVPAARRASSYGQPPIANSRTVIFDNDRPRSRWSSARCGSTACCETFLAERRRARLAGDRALGGRAHARARTSPSRPSRYCGSGGVVVGDPRGDLLVGEVDVEAARRRRRT